jgi:hypothetical protein
VNHFNDVTGQSDQIRSFNFHRRNLRNKPMSPIGTSDFRIFAAWRLGVSHPLRAETVRDSCNSSLQLFTKRSHSGLRFLRFLLFNFRKLTKRSHSPRSRAISIDFCETNPFPAEKGQDERDSGHDFTKRSHVRSTRQFKVRGSNVQCFQKLRNEPISKPGVVATDETRIFTDEEITKRSHPSARGSTFQVQGSKF